MHNYYFGIPETIIFGGVKLRSAGLPKGRNCAEAASATGAIVLKWKA